MAANQAPKSTCLSSEVRVWIRACSTGTSDAAPASTASTSLRCRDFSVTRATAAPTRAAITTVMDHDHESPRMSIGESVPLVLVRVVWPMPAS